MNFIRPVATFLWIIIARWSFNDFVAEAQPFSISDASIVLIF